MKSWRKCLKEAAKSVKDDVDAKLAAHLEGPQGKYGGGKAVVDG